MSQRASLVGGIISFVAVIVFSCLSLDRLEGGGFFMQQMDSSAAEAVVTGGDPAGP